MPGPFILGAAGIQGASSLAGGKKGASAATSAANIQAAAAMAALAQQQQVRQQNVDTLQPFVNFGQGNLNNLQAFTDASAGSPVPTTLPTFNEQFTFSPTDAQLELTPGYRFQRQQALYAAQGPLAAAGRGGWAPIGTAESVASGLAASNWQNVFNAEQGAYQTREQAFLANTQNLLAGRTQDLQQRQQTFNQYAGLVGTGLQAGGALAGSNLQSANQIASSITGAGAAQASGVVGAANALTGGLAGVGNAAASGASGYANQLLLAQALGSGGGIGAYANSPPVGGDMGLRST